MAGTGHMGNLRIGSDDQTMPTPTLVGPDGKPLSAPPPVPQIDQVVQDKLANAIRDLREANREDLKKVGEEVFGPQIRFWKQVIRFSASFVTIVGVGTGIWAFNKGNDIIKERTAFYIKTQLVEPQLSNTVNKVLEERAEVFVQSRLNPLSNSVVALDVQVRDQQKASSRKLEEIGELVKKATATLTGLEEKSRYYSTLNSAINGSRNAYDKLFELRKDPAISVEVERAIATAVLMNAPNPTASHFEVEWKATVKPAELTFDQLARLYTVDFSTPSVQYQRSVFVDYVWSRSDIPLRNRLEFVVGVIQNDENLPAVLFAVSVFIKETKQPYHTRDFAQYVDWWAKNRDQFK